MNREKLMEEMISKYGYSSPVPPEIRRRITDHKPAVFQNVLRRSEGYSVPFAALAAIFFLMKKMGIGLNFMQSMAAFFTAAAIATAAVTFGAYTAVKAVRESQQKQELKAPSPLENRQTLTRPAIPRPGVAGEITTGAIPAATGNAPSLSFSPASLAVTGSPPETASALYDALGKSLLHLYPGAVSPAGASALALKGALVKTGTGHNLYLRLVRPDGSILGSYRFTSPTLSGLMGQADAMTREIARGAAR